MATESISKKYAPSDNVYMMTYKNMLWGVSGLILGILVNNIVVKLSELLSIKTFFIQNIVQIILCSMVLAVIHNNFHYFGWTWQNTTYGFIFVSLFFLAQFKLAHNIEDTYILKNNN